MEFQLSYFKSWKMMLWECCTQYASKFGKLSSGHWKRSVFIPIPKKSNAEECSNYCTIALIPHTSKMVLKILQARLQQYTNRELLDFLAGFKRAEELEINLPTSVGSLENQEFQRNIYFCFIYYAKRFDCVDHNKLWKILKEMWILDHLTCLLRNLYAGQNETVGTGCGITDFFQSGKEYVKAVYCHPANLTYMQSTSHEMPG